MKTQNQKQDIKTTIHPQISKSINLQAVLISFLLFDLGVACMFFSQYLIGVVIIILAFIGVILKYRRTVYEKTGSNVKSFSDFIQKDKLDKLVAMFSEGDFRNSTPVKFKN